MTLSLSIVCWSLLLAVGEVPTEEQVRATVERSVPFIQTEGQRWMDDKKCVSCHQVPFMIWSLNAAVDHGFAVDHQKLQAWCGWARDWKHMASKAQLEQGERVTLTSQPDSVAQMLLGRTKRDADEAAATWAPLFAECLATGQLEEGFWKAGGQLPSQKRPERETNEVTTMWAVVALQSYGMPDESVQAKVTKTRSWLDSGTAGESTEWWAVRLLLSRGSQEIVEADRAKDELLKRQHEDGGWGWLSRDESDAFGTGVALYALARDGAGADDPAIARGRRFLTQTQQPDGSWPVKGTKKNKSKQVEPTATYWGTCWAVIGLAETLPCSSSSQ